MSQNESYANWLSLRTKYLKVFIDTSLIARRNCGREACITLIETCQQMDKEHENDTYYGDVEHGIINDEQAMHIQKLLSDARVGALQT